MNFILSEDFANDLFSLSQVTFIGPPPAPMQALGDKIGSTIIAQSAGVPTIAWNGDSLTVDYKKNGIPDSVYDSANVKTAEEALLCAERIGFPVMIKASEGGGGKGIRKALKSEEVPSLFRQVQGEIPGSPIFVMKMASKARHLEVQLLADKHGDAIALSGRDCSVQRRHQKIVEEGPPTAAPANVFRKMERAAVSLAKTVGYINAGTVEYLYMEETAEFAFLELNPRLQVEHPVTENILNINLPACQLQVAMGLPLCRIADIRRLYGRHPRGKDTIDFDFAERSVPARHCIAVRVTAENPEASFQPTSGKITELQFKSSIDCWGYFSVDRSGLIHEFADSQFGHIFAGGHNREAARRSMIVALKELQIRGEIRTTIEYIIKLLQSEDFIENHIDTAWLDGRLLRYKELAQIENRLFCPSPTLVVTCGAALQGFQHFHVRDQQFIHMLKVGQVPTKDSLSPSITIDLIFENVKYSHITCVQNGPEKIILTFNSTSQLISIRPLADNGYLLNVGGRNHLVYSQKEETGGIRMILDGTTCIFTPEYDPTKFTSTVAGKIARLLVPDGAHVNAGDAFVEIEVMKMYMPLKAQESGIVHFQKSEGASLTPGDLIARITLDNPDLVVRAEEFRGSLYQETVEMNEDGDVSALSDDGDDNASVNTPHPFHYNKNNSPSLKLVESAHQIEKVLEGYPLSDDVIQSALFTFVESKKHKLLPVIKVEEILSVLRGRIDPDVANMIYEYHTQYTHQLHNNHSNAVYPAGKILSDLTNYLQSLPTIERRSAFSTQISDLWLTIETFLFSPEENILSALGNFIESYLVVERLFDNMSFTDVVNQLRKDYSGDNNLEKVLHLCRSHANIRAKNHLILKVLELMKKYPINITFKRPSEIPRGIIIRNEPQTRKLKTKLNDLAKLRQPIYSTVSFAANLLLVDQFSMTTENRRHKLNDAIIAAISTGESIGNGESRIEELQKFIESNLVVHDLLIESLRQDSDYQLTTMELYLRKIYQRNHSLFNMQSGISLDASPTAAVVGGGKSAWISFEFLTHFLSYDSILLNRGDTTSASWKERNISLSDLTSLSRSSATGHNERSNSLTGESREIRSGVLATIESLSDLPRYFPLILEKISDDHKSVPVNVVHVIVLSGPSAERSDDDTSSLLSNFVQSQVKLLTAKFIRRVTFFVGKSETGPTTPGKSRHQLNDAKPPLPSIFTFRHRLGYVEDRIFRNVEAALAFHLDLHRFSNFSVQLAEGVDTTSGNALLYKAIPKSEKGPRRYFARIVCFSPDSPNGDIETLFVEALDQLSLALGHETASSKGGNAGKHANSSANHFFINVVSPDSVVSPDFIENTLKKLSTKYWYKMVRLAVTTVECKLTTRLTPEGNPISLRFVASNPTGYVLKIEKYCEMNVDNAIIFKSLTKNSLQKGPWDGKPVLTPYEIHQQFETQRAEAMASSDTLYVYDWPMLFESATEKLWVDASPENIPEVLFTSQELILFDSDTNEPFPKNSWTAKDAQVRGVIQPVEREPGKNDVGMVGWLMKIYTPEYPQGREIVVICNDITFQAGSFGTREDIFFFKASEYARQHGLPRLYLTGNSGARIGMAQSLKNKFQICWTDEKDPAKGFKYIYLNKDDYDQLLVAANGDISAMPIICQEIEVDGGLSHRYVITDIIGEESDLGVENLMGSGLIAGETARAYNDIFTLTLVVGRTVGIGAYLVRLGQRTIQKTRHAPIILTGYQALNKLMGREIYTTNDQLGGTMIMFPNGVSHLLAETHLDAVTKSLEWLSYVPAVKGAPLPIRTIDQYDPIDRPVQFLPQKGVAYDPRLLLCGMKTSKEESSWRLGFFDKNSFVETLAGWAKTVVVGRGRLGGIPLGVIVTENRTAEAVKLADPADITSQEKLVQQAGGVWFPDSAYKTAQALRDFNREGLPCIIFANWRGFSGGQRDMFDEVLKFGSMIVDALVAYQQPLFVYIPPFAELRGGAWVVVDSTINSDVMEFYAAEDSRGGVLEAAGAASIKFREREIIEASHRTDHALIQLDKQLKALNQQISGASDHQYQELLNQREDLQRQIKQREKHLFGVYQQVAVHFADLHDTPGRMKAKGVIRQLVRWSESRKYFYWRLRRRLQEFEFYKDLTKGLSTGSTTGPVPKKRNEFLQDFHNYVLTLNNGKKELIDNDQQFLYFLQDHPVQVQQFIQQQKLTYQSQQLTSLLQQMASGSDISILADALKTLAPEDKEILQKALTK